VKLLIADDNPSIRGLVRQLCAGFATEMRDCGNGVEAIALFEEFQPDWTLMDLMMPEMDGLTATAGIKARCPGARVVIVTEMRSPEYRKAALHAGACAFVLKENLHTLPQLFAGLSNAAATISTLRPE
jgi:CheY-like chemotaxis protein